MLHKQKRKEDLGWMCKKKNSPAVVRLKYYYSPQRRNIPFYGEVVLNVLCETTELIRASVAIERRGGAKRDVSESLDISELNLSRNGIYSANIHYGEMTRMSASAPRLDASSSIFAP